MADQPDPFADLMGRVRAGESEAAAELVRRYEPEVRRFVRYRLTSASVRRFLDSFDICQSVLTRFFVSLRSGDCEVATPRHLEALLLTMARNRIYDAVSAEHAARRDARKLVAGDDALLAAVSAETPTPSQVVETDEILLAVQNLLTPEDRQLVEHRMNGREWTDLAREYQTTPDAVRKRVTRALDQAAAKLGIANS
jgi:RNA polymerase sigma-70 factor (ECF subfamily)